MPLDATLCARLPLSVGEANLEGVIVPLGAGPRVTGRVEFEGTADKPSGVALTGIRINLDPADGSRLADATLAFQAGRPDEDGTFRTFGVPPGQYVLRANPPHGWTLKGAFLNGRDLSDTPFELGSQGSRRRRAHVHGSAASLDGSGPHGHRSRIPTRWSSPFRPTPSPGSARGAFPRRMRTARAGARRHLLDHRARARASTTSPPSPRRRSPTGRIRHCSRRLSRVARHVRVLDGERRTQDLTTAVIR